MPAKKRSTDKKRKSGRRKVFRKTQRSKRRKQANLRQLTGRVMDYNAFVNPRPNKGTLSQFLSPRALSRFSGVNKRTNQTLRNFNRNNRLKHDIRQQANNLNVRPGAGPIRRMYTMEHLLPDARSGSPTSYKNTYSGWYRGPTDLSPSPSGRKSKKNKRTRRKRKTKRRK